MNNSQRKKRIIISLSFLVLIICSITFVYTYSRVNSPIIKEFDENGNCVIGNTVYVNEVEADYYYYMGLNYTYHINDGYGNDNNMPKLENQNKYNDNNLVQVKITYKGEDFNKNIGYVSLTELQDTYVYNKIMEVKDNYIEIQLIENPFTDRPNDMGFNGWITMDNNIQFIEDEYGLKYAKVPVTYTDGVPNMIEVTFNASWALANVGYVGGDKTFDDAFSNLKENEMVKIETVLDDTYINNFNDESIMVGFYKSVNKNNGESVNNLYNNLGEKQVNSNCSNQDGCVYYEYINYYDESGNINYINKEDSYYYLNTKETNIIVMDENTLGSWTSNKEFTLTSVYNDTDYRHTATWDVSNSPVICKADTTIENIKISSGLENNTDLPTDSNDENAAFYGRWFNVRLGRGILRAGNYTNFSNVIAGYNENIGTDYETKKYNFIVESGYYDNISLTSGSNNYKNYINTKAVFGNDYDKVTNNNELLNVYYTASGSYGASIESPVYKVTDIIMSTVKSGSFGISKKDDKSGFIVGSIFGGTHNSPKDVKVEGGWIYNLIGDSAIIENRKTFIDVRMFMTGGRVEMIIGGSDNANTYGHRFIQLTGGQVGYSVIGGNNSFNGELANLDGNTVIYIGGNAVVGDDSYIESGETLYSIESGNVFGSGNGNELNQVNNSNIIINDEAIIKQNVYLGGNYATVGLNNSQTVKLKLLGGTIHKNLYGSGKYNGIGTNDALSTIDIDVTGGNVLGAIYGGSDINGTVYGDVDFSLNGGNINEVYGGGRLGANENFLGTFISGNVEINVGENETSPQVNKIYGGSEYGTVNGTNITEEVSESNIVININSGEIENVFGGAKGSDKVIPHILGTTTVNIKGGTVQNVYGANDVSGVPNGGAEVYLTGGTIGNAYGGGNAADINTTNLEIDGAVVESVFGGSNVGGTATITNITMKNGTVTSIHGGNDYGGFTEVSNIDIDGGTITNVYGGGRFAPAGITNVSLNETHVENAFGGGENADVTVKTNVVLNGSIVENVYGGSDRSGDVLESNIKLVAGDVTNIFGGNNLGGITYTTNVDVNGSRMQTIYGGGNEAYTKDSTVIVRGSNNKLKNVYGGSKLADVDNSKVEIYGGMFENIYGGSHLSGTVQNSSVIVDSTKFVENDVYLDIKLKIEPTTWQSTEYKNIVYVTLDFVNDTDYTITEYNGTLVAPNSKLFANYTGTELIENDGTYTFTEINRYWGTNPISAHGSVRIEFSILTNENIEDFVLDNMFDASDINNKKYNSSSLAIPKIDNIYGGNNQGGTTNNSSVLVKDGLISYIYGGGNNATSLETNVDVLGGLVYQDIYGGGNNASTLNNTNVEVVKIDVGGNVYGGGNLGTVGKDTFVYINNSNINKSVYAGGNGVTATVYGGTKLNIDGISKINGSVFGGGNAADTGDAQNNKTTSEVNVAGATINGSVYGGANTAVLYGETTLNIGINTVDENLEKGDIYIGGTVFGGGEANAEGDEEYDYSFISVTKGITINIDGKDTNLDIVGSIFGSGNASSTSGYSYINVSNYGNIDEIKRNISIQRTGVLTLDNTFIELIGTTDRTNEYSDNLYSLSRIDELKLKNNSTIYLKNGANLLKKFTSLSGNEKASVNILDNSYERNVDNRVYLYEKIALNVALNEQVTTYGEVSGMTFLGMYKYDEDENIEMHLYDPKYTNGSEVPNKDLYAFNDGAYVLGKHLNNHDITKDGFYTNKLDIETLDSVNYEYVKATPEDANYYMWVVGELVMEYEFDLTASKYATLGTYELPLINSSSANTTFKILNFDYSKLNEGVQLINPDDVPRVSSDNEADSIMGLSMKTSNTGWIMVGETNLLTDETNSILGTKDYLSENSNVVPSLLFSLYHSKNITTTNDLGTATITVLSLTPINETDNKVERINININLKTALYGTNNYEGVMTQGEEFDIFTPTTVDITTKSKLSAYYSLYLESNQNIYRNGYHRVLVSNYIFPENTKITMVDLNSENKEYYYYVVTNDDVVIASEEFDNYGEVTYDFSKFVKMGSSSNNNRYDDEIGNSLYYNSDGYAHEEFIFIVDFSESEINEDKFQNLLLVELRDDDDRTLYSVLGVQHADLTYNLYSNKDAVIKLDASLDTDKLYLGNNSVLTVNTNFKQQNNDDALIYDTNFFGKKLGIKITFIDSNGNQLTGTDLLGLYYEYNGNKYYPRVDGSVRMNIAERVANVSSKIIINTENSNIASGLYDIKIESFGSADGIYYGLESSDTKILSVDIIDTMFGLNVTLPEKSVIIDKDTGFGLDDSNELVFDSNYSSGLGNPNMTISLYRRDYSFINSKEYIKVDLLDYITNEFERKSDFEYEYIISTDPAEKQNLLIYMKENLMTGTYKFVFTLYDGNTYIGDVYQYVIIK